MFTRTEAATSPFIPRKDGSRERFGRRRLIELIAIFSMAISIVALVGGTMLYRAFIDGQKDRLLQIALGMGETIEAVARFDQIFSQQTHPKGAEAATLSQAFDGIKSIVAHDDRVEIVIARRVGEKFLLLLSEVHETRFFDLGGQALPDESPFIPALRRAFDQGTGSMALSDPTGGHHERLAGFARIDVLDLALVVMIDTAHMTAPFGRALAASAMTALLAIGLGAFLIRRSILKILARLSATVASLSQSQRIARVGNWEWDIARGRFWLSDEAARILGVAPQAIATFDEFLAIVPDPDRVKVASAIDGTLRHNLSFTLAHRLVHSDGNILQVRQQAEVARDANGQALRMIGTVQDISESHRAAETLAENEERFRVIFEQAATGINLASPDRRWLRVNARLSHILGYKPSELVGRSGQDFTHPDDNAADAAQIKRLLAGEIKQYAREKRFIRKDGATVWASVTTSVVREADGAVKYMISTIEDSTARKEAEEQILMLNEGLEERIQARTLELREARDKADDANVAKSRFLSSMSHEIRTPLNAILGFAQLLEHDPRHPLHADQKSCVEEILKGGSHLLALINDILDLSRIEAGKMTLSIETVQLPEAVASCLAMVRPLADRRGIVLADQIEGRALPTVAADYTRLRQVLTNFLSNAIKYNREKGMVTVSCQIRPDRKLRIAVTDTGRGISEGKLKEMFTPFNRLGAENSAIEGTGVGLVITRRLVELMGGEVGVDSVEGRGSTFWFDLPLDAAAVVSESMTREDQHARVAGSRASSTRRSRLVLYVEDNPSNQMLMERVVAAVPKTKLMMASSAELGIEMVRGERPDLILMDINLPGMDGYAALKELRADDRTRSIPVLALSANAMPSDLERGQAAGFARYIVKPFVIRDMIEILNQFLPAAAPAADAAKADDGTVVLLSDRQQRRAPTS